MEFSRRPRGIPVWAAMRTLGREGIAELIERNCAQAQRVGDNLSSMGFKVLNRIVLNQVLFRCETDAQTLSVRETVQASGEAWFGGTIWHGRPALRISLSSYKTTDGNIDALMSLVERVRSELIPSIE